MTLFSKFKPYTQNTQNTQNAVAKSEKTNFEYCEYYEQASSILKTAPHKPNGVHLLAGYIDPQKFWTACKGELVPCPWYRWSWLYKMWCKSKCKRRHRECILDAIEKHFSQSEVNHAR